MNCELSLEQHNYDFEQLSPAITELQLKCYDIDYVVSLNMSLSEPQYSLCYYD